jgi:hypothetical protein
MARGGPFTSRGSTDWQAVTVGGKTSSPTSYRTASISSALRSRASATDLVAFCGRTAMRATRSIRRGSGRA